MHTGETWADETSGFGTHPYLILFLCCFLFPSFFAETLFGFSYPFLLFKPASESSFVTRESRFVYAIPYPLPLPLPSPDSTPPPLHSLRNVFNYHHYYYYYEFAQTWNRCKILREGSRERRSFPPNPFIYRSGSQKNFLCFLFLIQGHPPFPPN